jgi:uncharacterized membrane protein
METTSSLLDRAASIPGLRRLLAAGALRPDETMRLEQRVRRELPWRLWLDRGLLVLAVVLIVAGVGYFFAHNWQHLTENDKLGLAAGSVLAAFAGAMGAGVDRFLGKLLLLAASMLVGVFIAVFGQVYLTGADTYELFQAWAVLILPWVILGRFMPLWIFWLGLIDLAIGFFWPSFLDFLFDSYDTERCFRYVTLSLVGINLVAWLIREGAGWRKIAWVGGAWSAWIILATALAAGTVETSHEIVRTWDNGADDAGWMAFVAVLLQSGLILALVFYHGRLRPSLPPLALCGLSGCWVLMMLAARMVFLNSGNPESGQFLVMGVLVLAIFGGGVFLLRVAARHIVH